MDDRYLDGRLSWYKRQRSSTMNTTIPPHRLYLQRIVQEFKTSDLYMNLSTFNVQNDEGISMPVTSIQYLHLLVPYCNYSLITDYAFTLEMIKEASRPPPSLPSIFFSAIFLLFGAVGVLGNLLTVCVIYSTTSLHSHTNLFLASLAVSDLLLIIIGVPFDLLHEWKQTTIMKVPAYCEITSTSISLFTFASTLTIVFLTFERFVAICYPFSLRSWFDRRRVIRLIYFIWIVAFIPSVYSGLQYKRVTKDFCGNYHVMSESRCDYTGQSDMFQIELHALITFILPLLFIIFCYMRILHTLNEMAAGTIVHLPPERRLSRMCSTASHNSSARAPPPLLQVHTRDSAPPMSQQAQRMVIKMLVTVTAIFFLCYLPHHLQRLLVVYHKCDSAVCRILYPLTGLLQYVSATLNPILYNVMSLRFRVAFRRLMNDVLRHRKRELSSIVNL